MRSKALKEIVAMKMSLDSPSTAELVNQSTIQNPIKEVENSLVSFMSYRLRKLQEAVDYEDDLKTTIMDRISEATFPQLMGLLEIIQKGNNTAAEKMLLPFLSNTGKTLGESLRDNEKNDESIASQVYQSTDDHKMLQAIDALSHMVRLAQEKKQAVDARDPVED